MVIEPKWCFGRTEHKCYTCGETIPAETRHQVASLNGKRRNDVRLCERCAYAAMNKVLANGVEKLDLTPGCFSWDKLNNKFRQWWRELMETRRHEMQLLEKITGRL